MFNDGFDERITSCHSEYCKSKIKNLDLCAIDHVTSIPKDLKNPPNDRVTNNAYFEIISREEELAVNTQEQVDSVQKYSSLTYRTIS